MRRPARARSPRRSNALDAFVIDGIRHNIPFLSALMAASALAGRQAVDRLHRRGVSARLPRRRAGGRARRAARRGRRRDRPCAGRAQAPHLRPDDRPRGDARAPPRGPARRPAELSLDVGARGRGRSPCISLATTAMSSAARVLVVVAGSRAIRCGSGTVDGQSVAVQVRPPPTASCWRIAASRRAPMSTPSARPRRRG